MALMIGMSAVAQRFARVTGPRASLAVGAEGEAAPRRHAGDRAAALVTRVCRPSAIPVMVLPSTMPSSGKA